MFGGFLRITGARILWTLWGSSNIWVIWTASPVGGRLLAAALAAAVWALASTLALRGLTLRPVIHNHAPATPAFSPEFRPEPHIHATLPTPTPPGDDTPTPTVIQFPNR
ncbi:hypothetical protein ACFRR6_03125 [Streptomyces sp. NPDC056891]|uniref:hypothetical protein n=1 Tax=Streptomyces sp. NPDC056891 TaxID=3345961 RepID=UPI0036BF9F63